LFNFIQKGVNILTQSLWPEMSVMLGSNQLAKAKRVLRNTTLLCGAGATFGSVLLLLFGASFYSWWTEQSLDWSFNLALGLAGVAILKSLWVFQGITIISVNRHGRWSVQFMTTYGVMLFVFMTLTRHYGLTGLVCTMICAEFLLYCLSFNGQKKLFIDLEKEILVENTEMAGV